MNSFAMAWPLVPMVKYDSRYAVSVGKWMLNVTNASRLCYPYEIDDAHQWLPEKKEISRNVIAYEGLRKSDDYGKEQLKGISPVAIGDGPKWTKGQPDVSMFSLYSSAQVGVFGSIVRKTNVDRILQLNCNATDFYRDNDYPTYLYYNPYEESKKILFNIEGKGSADLYDALTHERMGADLRGETSFTIAPKTARLVIVMPAGTKIGSGEKNFALAGNLTSSFNK
jgi:hypothetical protein